MKFFLLISAILISSCEGDSTTERIVGGHKELDLNDPAVEKLLSDHLQRLDAGSSGTFALVSKTKITQQVVSGLSYRIYGTFKAGDQEETCIITIWHRAWIQEKNESVKIKAECGADNSKLYKAKDETSEW
jgi:hypothetical protein